MNIVGDLAKSMKSEIASFAGKYVPEFEEVGVIEKVYDGIAVASGLKNIIANEMVIFENGQSGIALNLEEESVVIVIIGDGSKIKAGDSVKRTKQITQVPVGRSLLGRVVNSLGEPLDGLGAIQAEGYRDIDGYTPSIMDRKSVCEPLYTGIAAIDVLIPIGRGQRELIIGDRQTGKSAIALSAILMQAQLNENLPEEQRVYSVYVAIGQKMSSIAKILNLLRVHDALKYTIIVVSSASDSATSHYLGPYAGTTMAEYFRDSGRHALIVYDDLSKHAVAYREISLLLRRSPGREAYPGDIFYLHSRLLERAAKLSDDNGGGSLTALPIIETQSGDVSAYIPTNVISITDGQIFLDMELFNKGMRPAINVGLSVSRVGSAAQIKAIKQVAGSLKLELAQYREMYAFTQFSSDVEESTKVILNRGARLIELLKQNDNTRFSMTETALMIFAGSRGLLDDIPVSDIGRFRESLLNYIKDNAQDLMSDIESSNVISDANIERANAVIAEYKRVFIY